MKKIIFILIFIIFFFSCKQHQGNMVVKGEIIGLKKGILYLQKKIDTSLVSVDSIRIFGNNKFVLTDNVDSPVMYYLTLGKNNKNKRIIFFGEPGLITIKDNIEEFGWKPKIRGSKNQQVMDRFNLINRGFKNQRLDYIAKDIEARKNNNFELIKKLKEDYRKFVKRRFLSTANFAISNNNTEAAPYIVLSELFDANLNLLDTINKSLTRKIKNSKYGKSLNKFISDIKSEKIKQEQKK